MLPQSTTDLEVPILYSFRRCPYAIRARLALIHNQINFELREINLKDKHPDFLVISKKGTVPVLQVSPEYIIDESLDIMFWAFTTSDRFIRIEELDKFLSLIDTQFKYFLDRYKYSDRFPEHPPEYYRGQAKETLDELELMLSDKKYLSDKEVGLYDFAIFPMIRQFYNVDKDWFLNSNLIFLNSWLKTQIDSDLFNKAMEKVSVWE